MNFVEFYCGSATMANTFKNKGYDVFTVDNRKRKGKCEPSLKIDILNFTPDLLPFNKVNIAWFGQPCTAFSHAAGNFYYNGKHFTPKAKPYLKLLDKTIQIINQINPDIVFIENPRGHIIKYEPFLNFIKNNRYFIHTITLGSYGFPTQKPTYIITNKPWIFPYTNQKFGRGAKSDLDFDNLTTCQRQKYPVHFCDTIYNLITTQNL